MILTQCPVCAAELPPLSAKQCSRCKTRYCGADCQKTHWEAGGHDQLCRKIRKGGGAEQYNANTKYTEAVAVAAEACAEDTKGQTCYICTQALHWKTKEGLVRGCSCRGTAGFAHVSCLAEEAKILVAEAEENNLGCDALYERLVRWYTCGLCEQAYHGVVRCALGWACWKTYLSRPEADVSRRMAMSALGNGLDAASHHEESLSVREADLAMLRRRGADEDSILVVQANLANDYEKLGHIEKALFIKQDVYSRSLKLLGEEDRETFIAANNYANALIGMQRFEEAKALMRTTVPVARRVSAENDELTLHLRWNYAQSLYLDSSATLDDLREAVETLEDTERTARRVLGGAHPTADCIEKSLRFTRGALHTRETADENSLRDAMEAMTPGDA